MPSTTSDHRPNTAGALSPIATGVPQLIPMPVADGKGGSGIDQLISPAFLWWVFQQWWRVGVPAGLVLAAIVAGVIIYFHVPRYEAKAMLTIEEATPYVAFSKSGRTDKSRRYVQTQLELMKSPVVLEPVLSRPEIASIEEFKNSVDPATLMAKELSVRPRGGSELYDVSYTCTVPKSAAAVVNAIVEEYMQYHLDDDTQRTQRVVNILEEERRRRAVEVDRLRKRLVELTEKAKGTGSLASGGKNTAVVQTPAGALFQELTELDLDLEVLKAQKQYLLESGVNEKDPYATSELLGMEVDAHAETIKRVELIAAIEAQLETIKSDAVRYQKNPKFEESPAYIALQKSLKEQQEELVKFKAQLRSMILVQRKEQSRLSHGQEAEKIEREIQVLAARREVVAKRFAEQLNETKTGEGQSVELEFARAELAREETVFELIASRKLALQTEMRAPARIQLTRKASVPVVPVEPVPYKILILACAASLFAPFGLALCKELLIRRVSDVDQLSRESRLRILGEIAQLPVRNLAISPNKMGGRLQRDAHVFAESINILRTNLSIVEDLRDQQVLAILSASSGESKSSVAVSLAMSIANASTRPTLIIDGDMRSPDVASMLKTKSQPGLFEVLSGTSPLSEAIHHVGDSNLYVLPAGRALRSTHHLVQVDKVKSLLDQLRPKFSKILVDTPPVLGAGESMVFAKVSDAALFCSLSGTSKVKQVRMAVDRLESAGVNVAGAVLSGSSVRAYSYRYGYYPIEVKADG